jgi:hypothetical protein
MEQLNQEIIDAAKKYILPNGTCSLIHPDESPNVNTIYHLYNDGEITSQKGGWAYGQRSVFTSASPVGNSDLLRFTFRYVVLPYEECKNFRERMMSLLTSQQCNPNI